MSPKGPKKGDAFYDMPRAPGFGPRWVATIYYRTDAGLIDVEHEFEELDMLHDLVESGPSFYTIDRIEIRTTYDSKQTIEGALAE
jgi:hypothetical protein